MKRVAILGSTGSIGRQTLEVISWHRDKFKVALLAASSNVELLARQAESFGPQKAVILEEDKAPFLASSVGDKAEIGVGLRGLEEAVASVEMDLMVAAMVGIGSLPAVLAALKAGKTVALANKELLVTAGPLVTRTARMGGATLLPVDSEHSAIFQCLEGRNLQEVDRIILTASGGPFRHLSWEEMARVTPEEALRHPTWEMGPKVTVDSATLMNKGLEVIEARHLFDVPYERIEVVIHPQSLVHGLVRFVDGSLLAHLGPADMRLPIQYALSWPERWSSPVRPLDLTAVGMLEFYPPDLQRFPCLDLALRAGRAGGTYPAVLTAADEVGVEYFLKKLLPITHIPLLVERVLEEHQPLPGNTLDEILAAYSWGKKRAEEIVQILIRR